jgi:acyl carrier protein
MNAVTRQLIDLIERELGKAPGTLGEDAAMDLTDGWDSLKTMEIVIAVERAFDFSFSAKQMMSLSSVGAFRSALLQAGKTDDV